MRRFLVVLAMTAVGLLAGCGVKSYETRLDKTLEQMKYVQRLDNNLMPAPAESRLKASDVYIRPPKSLAGPGKEFLLTVLEPGKFDIAESYVEPGKSSLHVLARIKQPKGATNKKAAEPPPTNRNDFNSDVYALLSGVYNVEIDPAKAKEDSKGPRNKFKHLAFEANGKNVQVYLYGTKTTNHEVAMIFEYPKAEQAALVSKIDLALGAFEVGERAKRAYAGAVSEEDLEGVGATAESAGAAF